MNEENEYIEIEQHWLHVFNLQYDDKDRKEVVLYDAECYGSKTLTKRQFGELIGQLQQIYQRMED